MIEFKVEGLSTLKSKLKGLPVGVATEARKAMNQGALMIRTDAKREIRRMSAGKTVTRRGKKVVVSKPGDAPNSDTGRLLASVLVSPVKGNMFKGYSVEVKSITPYSLRLEYGPKGSKSLARPFMQPALEKNKKKINNLMKKAVRGAL